MNPSVTKAGFFPRLGAFMVDMLILAIVLAGVKIPVEFMKFLYSDALIFSDILFEFDFFDIVFYFLQLTYFVLFTTFTGTTIGKWLFKLSVVDEEGKNLSFWNALYRESIGKYLSAVFYLGYLMIFVNKDHKAFHDYLCDSYVVYSCKFREIKRVVVQQVYSKPVPAEVPVAEPISNEESLLRPEETTDSSDESRFAPPQ